jgi:hypothetical protein
MSLTTAFTTRALEEMIAAVKPKFTVFCSSAKNPAEDMTLELLKKYRIRRTGKQFGKYCQQRGRSWSCIRKGGEPKCHIGFHPMEKKYLLRRQFTGAAQPAREHMVEDRTVSIPYAIYTTITRMICWSADPSFTR